LIGRNPNLLEPELRRLCSEGGLWLIRPDGYIGLVTKRAGWDEVASSFDRIAAARQIRPGFKK
jgi:hypothetical protein